jgi:two-component system response regulator LytT
LGRQNRHFDSKLKVTLSPAFEQDVLVSREKATDFKRWLGE